MTVNRILVSSAEIISISLSGWLDAWLINKIKIEIVFAEPCPPRTTQMRFLSPAIFLSAVVGWIGIGNWIKN